jgi:CheY-like chemotaxis protein
MIIKTGAEPADKNVTRFRSVPKSCFTPGKDRFLTSSPEKKSKVKILLVEDEASTALAMTLILRDMGFLTCQPAATGRMALERLVLDKPDVVLMDINLPGDLNGIETVRRMALPGRPAIIFITGYSSPDLLERAWDLGPAAILTKPVKPEALKSAINSATDRRHSS